MNETEIPLSKSLNNDSQELRRKPVILLTGLDSYYQGTLRRELDSKGIVVRTSESQAEAEDLLVDLKPDAVLLSEGDFWLQGIDWLRKGRVAPLVVLSDQYSNSQTQIRKGIYCLEAGADDFIKDGKDTEDIAQRVKTITSRYMESNTPDSPVVIGDLKIDVDKRRINNNEGPLLTKKEWDFFELLVRNEGNTVSPLEFFNKAGVLFSHDNEKNLQEIRVWIGRVRKGLGRKYRDYVKTDLLGYRITGPEAKVNTGEKVERRVYTYHEKPPARLHVSISGEDNQKLKFAWSILDKANHYPVEDVREDRLVMPDLVITTDLASTRDIKEKGFDVSVLALLEKEEIVAGFKAGADMCLEWPINPHEMSFFIQRTAEVVVSKSAIPINREGLTFDQKYGVAVKRDKGKIFFSTPLEWQILSIFLKNPNQAFKPKNIADSLNLKGFNFSEDQVVIHVSRMRKKFGKDFILTGTDGYTLPAGTS